MHVDEINPTNHDFQRLYKHCELGGEATVLLQSGERRRLRVRARRWQLGFAGAIEGTIGYWGDLGPGGGRPFPVFATDAKIVGWLWHHAYRDGYCLADIDFLTRAGRVRALVDGIPLRLTEPDHGWSELRVRDGEFEERCMDIRVWSVCPNPLSWEQAKSEQAWSIAPVDDDETHVTRGTHITRVAMGDNQYDVRRLERDSYVAERVTADGGAVPLGASLTLEKALHACACDAYPPILFGGGRVQNEGEVTDVQV